MLATHVGDLAVVGSGKFLDNLYDNMCKEFGRLKPSPEPAGADDRKLTAEVTQFRSVLGGLLWLCSTRLDLVADVGVLQSAVCQAKVCHLRQANQLVKQKACAPDRLNLGLHYAFWPLGTKLRLQCIHACKLSDEGSCRVLALLMPELDQSVLRQDEVECSQEDVSRLSNFGHILFARGGEAKRVSYSTSHAEPSQQ